MIFNKFILLPIDIVYKKITVLVDVPVLNFEMFLLLTFLSSWITLQGSLVFIALNFIYIQADMWPDIHLSLFFFVAGCE